MSEQLHEYLSGQKLYGDDFSIRQIEEWYKDEAEGYANLGASDSGTYRYAYHALNAWHGFRHLPTRRFGNALGLGSAYGEEFGPIANHIDNLVIVDSSKELVPNRDMHGINYNYEQPSPDGRLRFENNQFDLITCFGVLHHIPNVSFVLSECLRCLRDDGYMLVREPIVSMGDWRKPRQNLTLRERGIPLGIFHDILRANGTKILKESLCMFPIIPKVANLAGIPPYGTTIAVWLDYILCSAFRFNVSYHASGILDKMRPNSIYFVLKK